MVTVRPWLATLRDSALLGVAAGLLGVAALAIQLDVPWVPGPQPEVVAACGMDELPPSVEPEALPRVAVAELSRRVQDDPVVIVDARSGEAFLDGHIPGAISLPAADAASILASETLPIPIDRDIVTYCDGAPGGDAEYVGRLLDDALGCDRVGVLDGGFEAWVGAGAPVEGALQSG